MNVQKLLRTSLFSVLALLLVGGLAAAQAQDIVVDAQDGSDDGSTPFATIQAAVDNATADQVIEVEPTGPYDENVTVGVDVTIQGDPDESARPVVDGGASGPAFDIAVNTSATIDGLEVRRELDGSGGNDRVIDGRTGNGSDTFTLTDNRIVGEVPSSPTGNLFLVQINNPIDASGNDFVTEDTNGNLTSDGANAFGIRGATPNASGSVIGIDNSGNGTANTFSGIRAGLQIDQAGSITVRGNTFTNIDEVAVKFTVQGSDAGGFTVESNDFGNADGTGAVADAVEFEDNEASYVSAEFDGSNSSVVKNNFFAVSGTAVLGENFTSSGSNPADVFKSDALNAAENFYGAANGPSDEVSATDGRTADGATVADGGNESINYVPFSSAEVGSQNAELRGPDNTLFVARGTGGSGVINDSDEPFVDLNAAIDEALPGETIVVRGRGSGTYQLTGDIAGLGGDDSRVENTSTVFEETVTFQALTGNSTNIDIDLDNNFFAQAFETENSGNGNVTLAFERDGQAFFRFNDSSAQERVVINNGEINVAPGAFVVQSSNELERNVRGFTTNDQNEDVALSRVVGGTIEYQGTPDFDYNVSVDGTVEASGEVPSGLTAGEIALNGNTSGQTLSFPVQNLSANTLTYENSNERFVFDGNLTSTGGGVTAPNDLTVKGTLTLTANDATLTLGGGTFNSSSDFENEVTGDVVISDLTNSGLGDAEADIDNAVDAIVLNGNTFQAEEVTLGLDEDNVSDDADGGGDATIEVGSDGALTVRNSIKTDLKGTTDSDSIDVVLTSSGNASLEIGGGSEFGEIKNLSNSTDLTFTESATVTDDAADESSDYDLSGGGNLEVQQGATLALRNESGSGETFDIALGGSGSTGSIGDFTDNQQAGTIELGGSDAEYDISTQTSATVEPSIVALQDLDFSGSGSFDIGALDSEGIVSFGNSGGANTVRGNFTVGDAGEVQTGAQKLDAQGLVQTDGGNILVGDGGLETTLSLEVTGDGIFTASGDLTVGTDLTVGENLSQVSIDDANLSFTSDGTESTVQLDQPVEVNQLSVEKAAGSVTLEGSELTVGSGGVTVENAGPNPSNPLRLESDLVTGATFTLSTAEEAGSDVNTVTGGGAVVIDGGTITDDGTGDASIQNLVVESGGATVSNDLQFGDLALNEGNLAVSGSSSDPTDLSPISDSTGVVTVTDASISSSDGTFNAEENEYDLIYNGNGSNQDTGLETGTGSAEDDFGLVDFTLAESAEANLAGDAAPRGDVLVDTDATLGAGGGELIITNAASTTFNGTVNAPVRGSGTRTIDGGENGVVASVTASGPNAEFEVLVDEVENTVTAADSASVTMDLSNEQTIGGLEIKGGGEVTLNSEVTNTGNFNIYGTTDSDDNRRRASVLSLGDNNLILEGNVNQGIPSDALPDSVEYRSDGGEIVFDTDKNVASSAQSIPNIAVRDADGSGSAPDPSIPSDDTLSFNESAALEAGFSGSGTLEATGTTITLDASDGDSDPNAVEVPTFTVNSSGSSVTEVIDGGAATDDESFLHATDSLNFETGELEHDARVRAANLNYSGNEFAVTATSGQIELEAAEVKLGGGLTIPVLATVGSDPSNLTANSAGTEEDLTVGDELTLGQRFETDVTDTGDLVIADAEEDVLVTRTNEYPDRDILDEALTFAGDGTTYDLSYEAADNNTSNITSGFEAASGADRIDSLAVDLDEDPDTDDGETLTFESNADFVEGAAVTANGALNLQSGDVDYGQSGLRDLAVSSGASYVRSEDATLDVEDQNNSPIAIEGSGYSITYQAQDGTLEPNVREFPEGREIAGLTVEGGTRDENGNEATSGTVDFTLSRAVSGDLEVDNTSSSDLRLAADTDGDGTLDFEEELDVSGNVVIEGRGTTDGGSVSSLSVGGDVTASGGRVENFNADGALTVSGGTASNADVAGDVSIEQGGSLEGNVTLSGEDSQALSLGADVNQAPLEDLTLAQTTSGESAAQVNLSGGDLDVDGTLTLSGGVLDAESDETVILTNGTFERNVESGEESHVAGRVEQTVSDNNLIVFPVGSAGSEYRPFEIALPEGTSRDLTIGHVTEDPGNPGLPTEPDNEGVSIQSTSGYFWTAEANQSLSITESFELAIRGTGLDESNESSFRILSGAEGNDFEQVGDGTQYANSSRVADGVIDIRTVGATSAITDETRRFTIGQPTAETAEGLQIAGQVNYPTVSDGNVVDGRALEGVEVEATSGDVTATATTDADGNFTIGGLDSGDYEVTANVDRDVSNVSIGDAQRTVSGFAGTEPFAGAFQEEVADVNASGTANATDALRIAFFDLGSISSFEAGSFLVDTTEVTLGSESESGVSIRVAEFGDADLSGGSSDSGGDASLATTTVSPKSSAQTAAKSATESAGDANRVAAGETFEVPVRVDRGAEVGSYSLSLEYDTEKATFEGISSGRDDIITNGSKEDGTLQVGWFDRSGESTLELTGGSELVTLRFSVAEGVEGAEFAPEITSGEINGPGAKAVAAGVETQAVRIAKPAPDEFALNGSYPNPASQQATVEMDLPVRAQVTVEVYNTLGQRVQTVEQSMSAGAGQTVQLDASQLASGQYFYRVKASLDGNQTRETGRLTIVK